MAAGDLIWRAGQAELRGLLLGPGTPYVTDGWSGLGLPPVRAGDEEREGADGSTGGFDTYSHRSIAATVAIMAADRDELIVARDALAAAMARTRSPRATVPFAVRLGAGVRVLQVRPRRLELPWEGWTPTDGLTVGGAFEVVALDPFAYALTPTVATAVIADDASSATVEAANLGTARSLPTVTFDGPATDPQLTNLDTGDAIRTDVTLGPSDQLTVDVAAGTMDLNGQPVWVGAADYLPATIEPGVQQLSYSRTGGGISSTATIAWSDAWLSI